MELFSGPGAFECDRNKTLLSLVIRLNSSSNRSQSVSTMGFFSIIFDQLSQWRDVTIPSPGSEDEKDYISAV